MRKHLAAIAPSVAGALTAAVVGFLLNTVAAPGARPQAPMASDAGANATPGDVRTAEADIARDHALTRTHARPTRERERARVDRHRRPAPATLPARFAFETRVELDRRGFEAELVLTHADASKRLHRAHLAFGYRELDPEEAHTSREQSAPTPRAAAAAGPRRLAQARASDKVAREFMSALVDTNRSFPDRARRTAAVGAARANACARRSPPALAHARAPSDAITRPPPAESGLVLEQLSRVHTPPPLAPTDHAADLSDPSPARASASDPPEPS